MKSWAQVYVPPIDSRFNFPALNVKNSSTEDLLQLPIKDIYRMYVCGITPYDATHLGHAATYITFDLINRYLLAMGKKVLFVENVTDVDDPLLERAIRDGVDWRDLAISQIELFRSDMTNLHVIPPVDFIGAVESIPLVIDCVEDLMTKDAVYDVEGDLYFSVRMDPEFGSRSKLPTTVMMEISAQRGGDPKRVGKRDPLDPLLWMKERSGDPSWPGSLGSGRPGWHIECCAIALKYLHCDRADEFLIDIQGGGTDLIFPHHEMGASQARILSGKPYARAYVHAGMIGLDGEKMSKSLGNLVFLSKLIESGADPMAVRIALMSRNYGDDDMWSESRLDTATQLLNRLQTLLGRSDVAPTDSVISQIIVSLSENLDTPKVIDLLNQWCTSTETGVRGGNAGELARAIDTLLGIAI